MNAATSHIIRYTIYTYSMPIYRAILRLNYVLMMWFICLRFSYAMAHTLYTSQAGLGGKSKLTNIYMLERERGREWEREGYWQLYVQVLSLLVLTVVQVHSNGYPNQTGLQPPPHRCVCVGVDFWMNYVSAWLCLISAALDCLKRKANKCRQRKSWS